MALTRISITLPRDLLAAADQRAKALDRSRSRVLVEALHAYLRNPPPAGRVREPAPPAYAAQEVADARHRHLVHDLELSPAERLRRTEELTRLARQVRRRPRRHQVVAFDSYEDFYEWKKAKRAGA